MNNKEIAMWGKVTIRNGNKIIAKVENHFVDIGLKGIMTVLLFSTQTGCCYWGPLHDYSIYIGSDTTTITLTTHSELQSPIGAAPGTAPNSKSISVIHDGTPDGDWYMTISATWNPGSVPAVTLGEAALYLDLGDVSTFQWSKGTGTFPAGKTMTSRLCSADGDFGSIVIDNTKPLVIDWTIHFTFA
jgi:hypothetical protein